jgi:hypothetical protein
MYLVGRAARANEEARSAVDLIKDMLKLYKSQLELMMGN